MTAVISVDLLFIKSVIHVDVFGQITAVGDDEESHNFCIIL